MSTAVSTRCPDTARVDLGGGNALSPLHVLKARQHHQQAKSVPHPTNLPERRLQPQQVIMVSTRKKDYGDAPPPKQRKLHPEGRLNYVEVHRTTSKLFSLTNTDKQKPITEFALFPKLPCEVRLMIWEASMAPRLVPVGPRGQKRFSQQSKQILPALFSVNKDSRHCALRHYTLRFIITLYVDETGKHRWYCPKFKCTKYHANVVMSPKDTLGLLGWDTLNLGYEARFRVKNADGKGPWKSYPINHGAQSEPKVKKVAFLGPDIASRCGTVQRVNSKRWDLNSILHAKSTRVRQEWVGPQYRDFVSFQSRKFNGNLEEWGKRLMYRAKHGALATWKGAPDILAFELGMEPKEIPQPWNVVPARSVQELYAVLPPIYVEGILDDFYETCEWRWSVRFPSRQGF